MTSSLPVSPPEHSPNWPAELHLGLARAGERTVLRENRHRGPLRVQKALYPEGDAVCQAIVLHPPSGIAGGDHLTISATVETGAHAQLTTPGAGKWYRSGGAEASQRINLAVSEGARARLETRVALAADSGYIGWDILCLGRAAAGERFEHGRFDLLCRVDRNRKPIWIERGGFTGDNATLLSHAGRAGATLCGTLLCTFPELPNQAAGLLEACRAIAPADDAPHAFTALPGILVARYLGRPPDTGFPTCGPPCARPAVVDRPLPPESGIPEESSWN